MTDPPSIFWDLLRGALRTKALAIVADLRVADALAAGPRRVEDVAREAGADPDTLHRLLRALASDGVFAEQQPGVFANTPASDVLLEDGWSEFADLFGGVWHRTVAELDAATHEPPFPVLSTILHDSGDERAAAMLRTIRAAAQPDARLLVIETVVPPDGQIEAVLA